jgi:hypothetical protein
MIRYGKPEVIVTDKLRSYGAAMKVIGNAKRQETGRWLNNRGESSHQPFRRRERAMLGFRSMGSLQKFVAVHLKIRKILVIVRGHSNASRSWFGAASGSHHLRTINDPFSANLKTHPNRKGALNSTPLDWYVVYVRLTCSAP